MKHTLCAVLLFSGVLFAGLSAQEFSAVIRELNGRVEVQAPGASGWVPASVGMIIEKAARISTGFKATARIALGESLITVRPLTRLTLEEITRLEGNNRAGLYLETGRVRAEVTPPREGKIDFRVRSPVVTASVRGTVFECDTANLRVLQGRIHYATPMGTYASVRAGRRSGVSEKANRVSTPREEAGRAFAPAFPRGSESGGWIAAASVPAPAGTAAALPEVLGNPAPPAAAPSPPWSPVSAPKGNIHIEIGF